MSFKISVGSGGRSFTAEVDETVLDAAIRHGLAFPYACRNGVCGACKGKVVSGEIVYPNGQPGALSETEAAIGQALFCCAQARSDLELEVHQVGDCGDLPVRKLPARVAKMERLADDVMRLWLKLPDNQRMQFLAGQYLDILLKDGRRRSFSMANAPHDDALLELHVRKVEGGEFTGHVFDKMAEKDILRIEGPYGRFALNEESQRPIIFVAGGTGLAPIQAMIDHLQAEGSQRPLHLYWGVRDVVDLYLDPAARWAGLKHLHYVPVLSAASQDWSGRRGWVHEAVLADVPDLAAHEVYAAGPPAMIEAARAGFIAAGLADADFYFDSFDFAPRQGE